VSCVSGAPDQVSDDELPIPLLLVSDPLSLLPVLLLPRLLTVMTNFLFGVSWLYCAAFVLW
jgi:hypothetical protein